MYIKTEPNFEKEIRVYFKDDNFIVGEKIFLHNDGRYRLIDGKTEYVIPQDNLKY